jgi:hypothetical protein
MDSSAVEYPHGYFCAAADQLASHHRPCKSIDSNIASNRAKLNLVHSLDRYPNFCLLFCGGQRRLQHTPAHPPTTVFTPPSHLTSPTHRSHHEQQPCPPPSLPDPIESPHLTLQAPAQQDAFMPPRPLLYPTSLASAREQPD